MAVVSLKTTSGTCLRKVAPAWPVLRPSLAGTNKRLAGPDLARASPERVKHLDEGVSLMRAPYAERRAQLETLNLNGGYWRTPEAFDDGAALFEAICQRELEGIVAKRVDGVY